MLSTAALEIHRVRACMIIVNNRYRAYEDVLECWKEMPSFSNKFKEEFSGLVEWCARNGRVDRCYCRDSGMSVEPYGIDLDQNISDDERAEALNGDETVVFATVNEQERAISQFWSASNLRWLK